VRERGETERRRREKNLSSDFEKGKEEKEEQQEERERESLTLGPTPTGLLNRYDMTYPFQNKHRRFKHTKTKTTSQFTLSLSHTKLTKLNVPRIEKGALLLLQV